MAKYLPLPDGSSLEVPDSMTYNEAMSRAQTAFPDLFKEPGPKPESGGFAAAKAGYQNLKGDIAALAGRTGLMDVDAAEKYKQEREAESKQIFKPTEEGWTQAPLTKLAELGGGALPYMAAPVAAGALGAMAPVAGVGLGAAGLASLAQFTGSNLSRQMEEGKALKETSLGAAAAAALPMAALDMVSLKMAPGIRNIFAAAGKELPKEAAEKIAKQGTANMLKDYGTSTLKTMGAEGLTEAGQQFFERLQAGLSLTDEKARDEYWDSLIGGAVLGGVIAPAGRYMERGAQQKKEAFDERKANIAARVEQEKTDALAKQAAATEEETRKSSPEYAQQVAADYQAAEQKKAELRGMFKDISDKSSPTLEADKAFNKDLSAQLKSHVNDVVKPLGAEYNRVQKNIAKVEAAPELQGQAELFPQAATPTVPQLDLFGKPVTTVSAGMAAEQAKAQEQVDYAKQLSNINNQLDTIREQVKAATNPADIVSASSQYKQLITARDEAQKLAEKQGKPLADQLSIVQRKLDIAKEEGDVEAAAMHAQKLMTLQEQGAGQQGLDLGKPTQKQTSESRKDFQERLFPRAERVVNLQTVQDQEQAALEEARAQEEATRIEAEKERKLAPEVLALRGMAKPESAITRLGSLIGGKEGAAPAQGSAAVAQMEQQLRGVKPGEELIPTAEEEKAPEERKFQKGPGFGLTNLRGDITRPSDYKSIAERLARVLSEPGLSQDAYAFLRRAEKVLPVLDHKIDTARMSQDAAGVKRDVASTEGVLTLLDQQLAKIERGVEGIGATPQVAERTKKIMGFDVPAPRRVIQGPSAKGAPLSLQAEIEPMVKGLEKAAEEPTRQGELFGTEDLGTIRSTRSAFIQASRSKAAEKGRAQAAAEKAAAESPAAKAREARAEETTKRNKANEELLAKAKADREAVKAMHSEAVKGEQYDAITQAQRLAREGKNELTPAEKAIAGKNPIKVLASARSAENRLTKNIRNAQKRSRGFRLKEAESLLPRISAMEKVYKSASAAEREAMMPALMDLERKYAVAANAAAVEDVQWPGRSRDIKNLEAAIRKVMALEELVNSGKLALPEEMAPRAVKIKDSTLLKQPKSAETNKENVAAAKERVSAATLGKEPALKSPQREKRLKEIRDHYKAAIEEKKAAGKPLNPFDENFLAQAAKAEAAAKEQAKEDKKKAKALKTGTEAMQTTSAQQDALTPEAKEALADGRLLDVLSDIAQNSKEPFIRENAEKLLKFVSRTKIGLSPDITVNGEAVPAAYNSKVNAIGVRPGYETEAAVVHEATHAATMRAIEGPESALNADQLQAKQDLTDMFNLLTENGTLKGEYTAENVKEFASEVQSNANLRDRLDKKKLFGSTVLRRVYNALLQLIGIKPSNITSADAQAVIERLYMQSGKLENVATAPSAFSKEATAPGFEDELATADNIIAKPKTIRERIEANLGLAFRTQALDRLAPLEKIAAEKMDAFKGTQMMYFLRMADQKMSFVQQAVGRGVPQVVAKKRADGQTERLIESKEGPNLANVVSILKDAPDMNAAAANKLFTLYLAGKRAERVGYGSLNFGVPEEQVRSAVAKIEANDELRSVFNTARDEYNAYNRSLMKFVEETGAITPEEAKRLSETNDYIPYYREENGNAVLVIGGEGTFKVGNLTDQPQLRQLIGGETKILDFLTSSVQNTSMLTDMSLRNLATKNAMYELKELGLAKFMQGAPSDTNIVRFKDKGEDKYVSVNTDEIGIPADLLVKGMAGIPVNNSAIVKAMGGFSTVLRRAVTLSPLYSARQLFRDSVAAPLLSGANFTPVVGALKQLGKSDTRVALESRGIVGGQVFTGTNEDLTRILGELQTGKMGVSQFIAKAEAVAMEADALTRRAQYDSYIDQGLSEMEATLMSLESMNFNRKGLSPSVRMASTMIPFFNAQIQSLDVLYRALTGKMPMNERLDIQGKLIRRGAMLAGTAVAYAMLMQDDETYKNANPDEKYGNFFVHVPGIKEAIRVPVPFEIGYIFKSLPEAIVNTMSSEHGSEEAYKAFKNIAIQTVPGGSSMFLPAALKPVIENVANYSFYTGRGIETKAEQMQLAENRFRDNTSETAKQLGKAFGVSPIKVDNLIRGYTGGMGVALAQSLSFAMPTTGTPEQAAKRLSDAAVIGPLFQPADAGGIVNATYERVNELLQYKKTFDDMVKDGRMADAKAFLQEHSNELAASSVAGNAQQQLGKITQAINAVKASGLSPEQKREQLDNLQSIRIKIASAMRGALDKTTRP